VKFIHCLRIVFVFWKYTNIFQGRGNFILGGTFPGGEVEIPAKILLWENLTEFLYEILVNCLTLSLPTQFTM
jgi:hypothetical protein